VAGYGIGLFSAIHTGFSGKAFAVTEEVFPDPGSREIYARYLDMYALLLDAPLRSSFRTLTMFLEEEG
ncbi:MAG: hypothetical protein ACP5Q4_07860, partial [Candidatus Caldatribacteriaceae bacterium]